MITNFDSRCRERGTATVAYLGGSITFGARATDVETTSWRALITQWLKARHPGSDIRAINAAIGGTGSDFACCRMESEVIAHKADLVFVEFAVNDAGTSPERVARSYEGVIRGLRERLPHADLIALFTLGSGFVPDYDKGDAPPVVKLQQTVCDHYGVPTVNVGRELSRHISATQQPWSDYFGDAVHPSDAGHAHYAATLQRAMAAGEGRSPSALLPAPRDPGVWLDGAVVTGDQLTAGSDWVRERRDLWNIDMRLVSCATPGSALIIPFTGSVIGLLIRRHAASGAVRWRVDDGPEQRTVLWDEYCPLFERGSYTVLTDDLAQGGHVLELRVDGQVPEGSTGTSVDLFGIMTARHG